MCSQQLRGAAALVHNFLVQWPEPQAFVKLYHLRIYGELPDHQTLDLPVVREFITVATALKEVSTGIIGEGLTLRWPSKVIEQASALVPHAEAVMFELQPLSDEHFRDMRHSHGEENILRESRGLVNIRFLPRYDYHYTVEAVTEQADLTHRVCSTGLKLHQHFKDELARDPTFYGKVWCPTCGINAPFTQFAG